ncbi:MAG: hypothetical protein ABR587_16415 [Candidatus Binatia bacterium]
MYNLPTKTHVRMPLVFVLALAFALPFSVTAGPPPADKCEASKNKIAGAYYACREKAESKAILKAAAPDYSKCTAKFLDKWGDAETKGAGNCPDFVALSQEMADYLAAQATEAASVIGGADIPTCAEDLVTCQNELAALGGGCDAPFACPATDPSHQTICGQLFDLEDGSRFQAVGATGTPCSTPTVDGPCSLNIAAYDALAFSVDPLSAPPLSTGSVYIDDCGRYRVPDVTLPSGPFIALRIDDEDVMMQGPTGSTNTVTVVLPKQAGMAIANFDGWVASDATTDMWESSGGPPVSGGIYIPIFREMVATTNRDLQDNVTVIRNGNPVPLLDHYFVASESARLNIDPAATATGVNGTALVTGVSLGDSISGTGGGLPSSCVWDSHVGASVAFVLSVQDFRPEDAISQTCDR